MKLTAISELSRAAAFVYLFTLSCSATAQQPAEHIFLGENIVTMADPGNQVSALAIRGEEIVWVGDRDDHQSWLGEETRVHELGSRALLPGFIDAHGHLTYQAASLQWANLAPPPVGEVSSIATLQQALADYIETKQIPAGTWVIGSGYDDSLLTEQRHPNRDDLDAVSSEHPIALLHVSGHLSAVNSTALAKLGISAESADPPGGLIRRRAGTDEPDGVLEETATYPVRAALQQPAGNPVANVIDALALYASYGITTVQDGAITSPAIELLQAMDRDGLLSLDVVIYPLAGASLDTLDYPFGSYQRRLKFGGVKIILDGSPQGKTAYLSQPYAVAPAGQNADYLGYPTLPQATVDAMLATYLAADIPVLAHANGDAAAQMLIDAVAAADATSPLADHRTVMIHAQTVREDQLDRMAELAIMPSYFSAHTFYWGDWHRDSVLGESRAARISPTRSTLNRGMPFTIHNDSPIVPPDMLRLVWATTNRLTRSGRILGPEQRLDTYEALRAITADAAYQYFEEDRKGTLEPGKLADLVILSANPLQTPPGELQELQVLETWSHGSRVFAR
jgi:predicted amidohydrolase YtcJ